MPLKTSFANKPDTSSDDVRTDADERAWADRIRAGDMDAFEALYRTYWQRLYSFAFRYVHSKEDAKRSRRRSFSGSGAAGRTGSPSAQCGTTSTSPFATPHATDWSVPRWRAGGGSVKWGRRRRCSPTSRPQSLLPR